MERFRKKSLVRTDSKSSVCSNDSTQQKKNAGDVSDDGKGKPTRKTSSATKQRPPLPSRNSDGGSTRPRTGRLDNGSKIVHKTSDSNLTKGRKLSVDEKTRRSPPEIRQRSSQLSLASSTNDSESAMTVKQQSEIDKLFDCGSEYSDPDSNGGDWNGVNKKEGIIHRVLSGDMDDIPPLSSKIVRIFTSSTFTDTTVERNTLMENVYPDLKEYCKEKHGLEFQIVDMRWGVRDEASDDHMIAELCMQEIENCKRVSLGPNFVIFLGHKYGYRPMQRVLPASEFELILEVLLDIEKESLNKWYIRDDNAVPPVYVLRPISSVLANYNNKRFQSLMRQDRDTWWKTFEKINKILRSGTNQLVQNGKMEVARALQYNISVTEEEITQGVLNASDARNSTLAFVRTLTDVDFTKIRKSSKFVDVKDHGAIDDEAQALLTTLKDTRLPAKLPEENILRYEISCGHSRHVTMKDKKEYMEGFCDDFKNKVTALIDRAVLEQKDLSGASTYRETLQHLHDCRTFSQLFQGRDAIVERVRDYVLGASPNPLVLFGESGCGKTSLLAKCAISVISWLDPGANVIIRFLGTTPDSSTIIPLLTSLCKQLCFLYDQPTEAVPKDLLSLQYQLKLLLELSSEEKPVVLLLDSLDQLSGQDGAHQLAWLPGELPVNCKVVVSTLPLYYCLLSTLRGKIRDRRNFIEVSHLGEDLSTQILESWLKNADRKLTDQQWAIVQQAIRQCNLPLFTRLVFKEVSRWASYSELETTTLGSDIEESIAKLLAKIELTHGETIVSHALGYITASKSGVSEAELEDLLSLDDTVLSDVYQYHVPPIRRIPPLLWNRIRNDLPRYLTEREADGVSVIDWFHRQFIDASSARYFKNLNFKSTMHRNLAEYFMGTWSGKPKPFLYTDSQKLLLEVKTEGGACDRLVPSQQLATYDDEGNVVRYNLRALSELPYHLIKSHNFSALRTKVLFNYKWLHTKLSCMPLQTLMADFELALEFVDDKEIRMLSDAIGLSSSVLASNPGMLGPQIVGRLLPYYTRSKMIRSLIDQCDSDGIYDNALIPSYQCFHTPGGPLQYSFEGHPLSCYGIAVTSDDRYLVSVSNRMIIWDLTNGVIFREIDPCTKSVMQFLVLDSMDRYAVALTRGSNEVVLFSLVSGESRVIKNPCTSSEPLLGLALANTSLCVWSSSEWCILRIEESLDTNVRRRCTSTPESPIIHVEMKSETDLFVVKGEGDGHVIEKLDSTLVLHFTLAMVMNDDGNRLYATVPESKHDVVIFQLDETSWKLAETLAKNDDPVYSMALSNDEGLLVATIPTGFKVWEIASERKSYRINYPSSQRNIPQKNYYKSSVTMSKDNKFLIAAVKTKLFVWKLENPDPIRVLEDHFERIVSILSRSSWCSDLVLTSSLDKTVKCWNMKNILEQSHPIERMEKPIEHIDVAENTYMAAVVTRTHLGIFDLQNGSFKYKLKYATKGVSVVTQAVITSDANYCISSEDIGEVGYVILWDLSTGKPLRAADDQTKVMHIVLTEEETKVVTFSKVQGKNSILCVCRDIPSFDEVFRLDYTFLPPERKPILTSNGLYFVALSSTKGNQLSLKKFHSKTGVLLDSCTVRYLNFIEIIDIVAVYGDDEKVVLVDKDKGNIFDLQTKQLVRSVPRWNGKATRCGRFGVHAPGTGGVEVLDLEDGSTAKVFLRRTNEGLHNTRTMFISNDRHLLYYHAGHKTVRLFNVWGRRRVGLDGRCVANYHLSADVRVMASTPGGGVVVIGTADGRVTALTIADPRQDGQAFGRDLLLSVRKQYYEAEFIEDESFKTIVRKEMNNFEAVVEEVLKIKNEGTDKADTIGEWRQEQVELLALENEESLVHTFVNKVRKTSNATANEEALDQVDGEESSVKAISEPDATPSEGPIPSEDPVLVPVVNEEEVVSPPSARVEDVPQPVEVATEPELAEENEPEKAIEETATGHSGVDALKPIDGAVNTWRYSAMGVIVNQVAMGDAYDAVQKEFAERQKNAPSMGATMRVATVVARTRRWKAARDQKIKNEKATPPKSVTCSIS